VKTTSPLNVDNDVNVSGRVSYSTPIRRLAIKTRVSTNVNYRNNIVFINSLEDRANRYTGGLNLSFENRRKDNFDAEIGGQWNYNTVLYNNSERNNTNYLNQRYYANFVFSALKKWNFKTGMNVNLYSAESFGEAAVIPIWTASISRYFLKGDRGEFRISAFDLLNQNQGFNRSNTLNYIETSTVNSLGRYFMGSFIYNLKGNKEDPNQKMRMMMH
jgi:hypothetical protein